MGRIRLIGLVVGAAVLGALLMPGSALADTYTLGLPGDFSNPAWSYDAGSPPNLTPLGNCTSSSCSDGSGNSVSVSGANIVMGTSAAVTIVWNDPFTTSVPVTVTNNMGALSGLGCTVAGSGSLSVSDQAGALSNGSGTLPPGDKVYITLTASLPFGCSSTGTIGITATTPTAGGGGGGGGTSATLALASLGGAPLHIAAPTISGTTTNSSGAVAVLVYAGTSATGTPVRRLSAAQAGGRFSVTVLPALEDGVYTAVAAQAVGSGVAYSPAMIFRIKVYGPDLTLTTPRRHARVHRKRLRFAGGAGTATGDASAVTIYVYRGKSVFGRRVGKVTTTAHGSSWSSGWPKRLPRGSYTVVAAQRDDAGHTTHTSPHTFKLIK